MAVNCINYNCDPLPEYESTIANCGAKVRNGGASIMYLIECGVEITDPGDQAELDALVTAGDATEISGVKIGFGEPSPITIDAITSCTSEITTGYDRTFNLEDAKVTKANTTFWSTAKKRAYGGVVLVECETSGLGRMVTHIDAEVDVESFRQFPNTFKEAQKYIVTGKWQSNDDPLQYDYTP